MTRSIRSQIPSIALFATLVVVFSGMECPGQDTSDNSELGPKIQFETIDGDAQSGQLSNLTGSSLSVILADGQSKQWELTEIARIQFEGSQQTSPPTRVILRGGSEVASAATSMEGENLLVRSLGQPPLTVSIRSVQSIRFRAPSSATDADWLALVEEPQRRDRLVIRREGNALDPIEGTILEIKRDFVSFDLSGNIVDAPLQKLEGVIFSTTGDRPTEKLIQIKDQRGSRWMAEQANWNPTDRSLELDLGDDITHSIPVSQLLEIQFSGGILYLVDAEVAQQHQPDALSTLVGDDLASTWFATESNGKNLTTMLSSDHVVRVPDGYQKLVAAVRMSSDVDQFTPLKLSVLMDNRVVWTLDIEDRKPHGLILPLEDARRLTLRTSLTGEDASKPKRSIDQALGHRVEWLGARLLK
ncbi:hypothetical protein [Rhodopirellula bahusiensis]|uniref:Uncharacterized protein n=1 Tax=Rhodopirellula bahusiensis TaxID=2014065 RepID=A0A2G1WAH2_9BACT|nr:hypothetical protein [Rhodopirellula bahusiensis]PHQ36027.1 hypothetical protein CEE69_07495 [Rhodopirellula bahusiensis]